MVWSIMSGAMPDWRNATGEARASQSRGQVNPTGGAVQGEAVRAVVETRPRNGHALAAITRTYTRMSCAACQSPGRADLASSATLRYSGRPATTDRWLIRLSTRRPFFRPIEVV